MMNREYIPSTRRMDGGADTLIIRCFVDDVVTMRRL
jgi:hypothetical protein